MIISVAIFAFLSLASASDVLDLTDANFASKIADQDVVLVEFFAPWCGHCKRLAPEYEKAATTLKSNDPPVPLAKVDCSAQEQICKRLGLKLYPTLAIYKKGEWVEEIKEKTEG